MESGETQVHGLAHGDVLAWLSASVALLEESQELLDRSNVFPVADSDTGTNLLLTMRGALHGATSAPSDSTSEVLRHASLGALTNAHGNSGIILAEFLRGFANECAQSNNESLGASPRTTATETLVRALETGAQRAYKAVALPVEGTILTAASYAAHNARKTINALEGGDSSSILIAIEAAVSGATEALDRSHQDLEILAASGVLDAGAYGLVLVLSALRQALGSSAPQRRETLETAPGAGLTLGAEAGSLDGEFEVMCLVELLASAHLDDDSAEQITTNLRTVLAELGESVVVSGGVLAVSQGHSASALWTVHVHTDTPDHVLHALETASQFDLALSRIVIRNLRQQVMAPGGQYGPLKLIACVSGPLLAVDLSRAGAIVCVERGKPLGLADIERAVNEVHEHIAGGISTDNANEAYGTVILTHSQDLLSELQGTQYESGVVRADDDAQIVAAMSAIVADWEANHSDIATLVRTGRGCVQGLVTIRIDVLQRASLAPLINELESERDEDNIPIVTVLTDVSCPSSAVLDLVDGIERKHGDAEVIVLSSGRPGSGLTASVEWVDE